MIPNPSGPTIDATPPERRRNILGVRVDDVGWQEALTLIDGMCATYREQGRRHQVVTPNPEIVIQARRDPTLHAIITRASLVTADGVGIRWAGRMLDQPIRAVIPGSALTKRLAARHAGTGARWFLLGAAPGVAKRAAVTLQEAHPGLEIVGTHAGDSDPSGDGPNRQALAAAGPIDVLLVAYGTPAQERWIARNLPHLDVAVGIGVGGTFDFLAGEVPWPPRWAQRSGLIWLWRLVRQPRRARRQLRLVRFVGLVVRRRLFGSS